MSQMTLKGGALEWDRFGSNGEWLLDWRHSWLRWTGPVWFRITGSCSHPTNMLDIKVLLPLPTDVYDFSPVWRLVI